MVDMSLITAVPFADGAEAGRWFALVQEEYQRQSSDDPDVTWDTFREELALRARAESFDNAVIEAFEQRLEETSDPIDEVRHIAELGDAATAMYEEACAAAAAGSETESGQGYDEAAWNDYLLTNGSSWDGTEASWPQFKDWFLYYATEQGLSEPATAFIGYAEAQPDKVGTFVAYGVAIAGAPAASAADEAAGVPEVSEDVLELIGRSGLQQVLDENPQLADLSPDELDELLRTTLADMGEAISASAGADG